MESNANQNVTGGEATEVAGTAGATNQGAVAGQSVPTTSSTTDVAEQSAPATGGQSLASELEKELEATPAVDAGSEPEPAPAKGKKNSGSGLIIAMVFVILLAAGGIGFGVWAMMDGDSRVREAQSRIDLLSARNDALEDKVFDLANNSDMADGNETIEEGSVSNNTSGEQVEIIHHDVVDDGVVGGSVNPLIVSSDKNEELSIRFQTAVESGAFLTIVSRNGGIESCYIEKRNYLENGGYSAKAEKNCNITGLQGKIYKVVEFGPPGHDNAYSNVGFIMTDGSVQYFPLLESFKNDDYSIRGSLKIDGGVIDLVRASASGTEGSYGGYLACLFVLNNGTLVRFDESML